MRVALHATTEIGNRCGRILLAERDLTALGLYGDHERGVADRKVIVIAEPTGFDALVTDDADVASAMAGIACDDGLHCITTAPSVDSDLDERFRRAGRTLLCGVTLAGGIAASLAAHELAGAQHVGATTVAWTKPGKPRRRGVAVPFPDPVGPRWGRATKARSSRDDVRGIEVPIKGDWAAATVLVSGADRGKSVTKVVGVADHAAHLDAVALAAGVLAVLDGSYPPGTHRPDVAASAYLATAMRIGLGVAAFTESK